MASGYPPGMPGRRSACSRYRRRSSYCLALEEHGAEAVHRHVGREPCGQSFNELALNPKGLPHNPMVNAGAIMTTLTDQAGRLDIADRFDQVATTWRRLTGGRRVGLQQRGVPVRAADRGP